MAHGTPFYLSLFLNQLRAIQIDRSPIYRRAPRCRQAAAVGNWAEPAREHLIEAGVYIDVFEQSILVAKSTHRPLSFAASVSAEVLVVSVLVIIPLTYSDHLPDFHWNKVTVAPPVRPIPPIPVKAGRSSTTARASILQRVFVFRPPTSASTVQPSASSTEIVDAPASVIGPDIVTGQLQSPIVTLAEKAAAPPPKTRDTKPTQPVAAGPIRVSQGVQMAKLVKRVIPEYPPLARSARISGTVHLIGIIARDGTIRNLELVSGHPLLTRAAFEAVEQWIFKPTLLNGEPVEVIAPIDVNFSLGQ